MGIRLLSIRGSVGLKPRLDKYLQDILDLLDERNIEATFYFRRSCSLKSSVVRCMRIEDII